MFPFTSTTPFRSDYLYINSYKCLIPAPVLLLRGWGFAMAPPWSWPCLAKITSNSQQYLTMTPSNGMKMSKDVKRTTVLSRLSRSHNGSQWESAVLLERKLRQRDKLLSGPLAWIWYCACAVNGCQQALNFQASRWLRILWISSIYLKHFWLNSTLCLKLKLLAVVIELALIPALPSPRLELCKLPNVKHRKRAVAQCQA